MNGTQCTECWMLFHLVFGWPTKQKKKNWENREEEMQSVAVAVKRVLFERKNDWRIAAHLAVCVQCVTVYVCFCCGRIRFWICVRRKAWKIVAPERELETCIFTSFKGAEKEKLFALLRTCNLICTKDYTPRIPETVRQRWIYRNCSINFCIRSNGAPLLRFQFLINLFCDENNFLACEIFGERINPDRIQSMVLGVSVIGADYAMYTRYYKV